MPKGKITFQLATHFLPKIALRLECLYQTIYQACEETHPVIHHYALKNVIEIISLIEKPELKSRFLKEFVRIEHSINKAEIVISTKLYDNLYLQIQNLIHVVNRFGGNIHQDPFLQSVRFAQPMHNNECEMYTPQLILWLESPPSLRQHHFLKWLENLQTLHDSVCLYLSLLRHSAKFDKIHMLGGFYQCPLPTRNSCHLILLRIDKSFGIVPQMHLGHHGLSLRLCEVSTMQEIQETKAKLDLAICQL